MGFFSVIFSHNCILSVLRYAARKKIYLAGKVYYATFFIVKSYVGTNRLLDVFLLSAYRVKYSGNKVLASNLSKLIFRISITESSVELYKNA